MSNELRPCPCCGGEAVVVELGGRAAFRVKCRNVSKCGIETEVFDTEEEAEKAWNRRTPSDHIVDANKKVDEQAHDDLRPCLRCGGPVTLKRKFIREGVAGFYITCEKCGEMTNVFEDERALRAEWSLIRHESAYSMPDNMPLTTRELFVMDGQPVYIVFNAKAGDSWAEQWALVDVHASDLELNLVDGIGWKTTLQLDEEISGMRVYRRRPEDKKQ